MKQKTNVLAKKTTNNLSVKNYYVFIMDYLTTTDIRTKFTRLSKEDLGKNLKGKKVYFNDLDLELDFVDYKFDKHRVNLFYKIKDLRNKGQESKIHQENVYDTMFLDNLATSLGRKANAYRTNPVKFDKEF